MTSVDENWKKLYNRLNLGGAAATNPGWTLNSNEQLSSDFVFVRARSDEFNYSTNPSFISSSTKFSYFTDFVHEDFRLNSYT